LDIPTFSTSSSLPRHLNRESWSCKPVILDFCQLSPLVVFKRSQQPKVEICGW
jgi:hypothetical protein